MHGQEPFKSSTEQNKKLRWLDRYPILRRIVWTPNRYWLLFFRCHHLLYTSQKSGVFASRLSWSPQPHAHSPHIHKHTAAYPLERMAISMKPSKLKEKKNDVICNCYTKRERREKPPEFVCVLCSWYSLSPFEAVSISLPFGWCCVCLFVFVPPPALHT